MGRDGSVQSFVLQPDAFEASLRLSGGLKVVAIGGRPAGPFFSYFFLEMAARVIEFGLLTEYTSLPPYLWRVGTAEYPPQVEKAKLQDIYGPRDFSRPAPNRGRRPRTIRECKWESFDGYLLGLAVEKGASDERGAYSHFEPAGCREFPAYRLHGCIVHYQACII